MRIQSVTDFGTTVAATGAQDAGGTSDFPEVLDAELAKGGASSLERIFQKASRTYGVSEELLKAMAKAESNFDPKATSRSGAMGIMQLMPSTAKGLGVTDAYDPEQNIMGGAKYIASLLDKFDGNTAYALAAYNAGSSNVEKYGGIPPFEETQRYVAKILGYLEDGGVEIPDDWQGAAAAAPASESLADVLTDALKQLFTREDYEDFLRLFLERVLTRLGEGTGEAKEAGAASPAGALQSGDAASADASGNAREAGENGAASPVEAEAMPASDAYVAYRNFGNTNRISIMLKPE